MKFMIGIDNIHGYSSDKALLAEFCKLVEAKGHTVTNVGVGPSAVQNYALSHSADVMVQIAGGMCVGTLSDFCYGMKRGYYKAKKGCIPFYTKGWTKYNPETYKPSGPAWDDKFSRGLPSSWFSQFLNITFPEMYTKFSQYLLPYSHGKSAQEMADKMLSSGSTGATGATGGGGGGGQTGFDLIKQVITPWDKYGVALELTGSTLHVYRATTKNAPLLTEDVVVNDSISITDYASQTPNYISDGKNVLKNDFLIQRFGKIEPEEAPKNKGKIWLQDMYQVAQRDSGHTIDMKVLFDPKLKEGMYVHLKMPTFDIDGYYYISKTSVEEEQAMSITLDPAPPSRYQEVTETTVNTGTGTSTTNKDPIAIGNALAAKYKFASQVAHDPGQYYKGCEDYACMKAKGNGSCFAWSDALYTELNAAGIKARIIQYAATGGTGNHRSVQINTNGSWEDYPYRSTNISQYARSTKGKGGMFVYRKEP